MNKYITNIVKNYLLPSKIIIVNNKLRCLSQLLDKTFWIRFDLNNEYKSNFYKHVFVGSFDNWQLCS
jgi:hypothetical protein